MKYRFASMTEVEARAIQQWSYEKPYDIYNLSASEETITDMLDTRSPHFSVHNADGQLVGFLGVGTVALVWDAEEAGIYVEERTVPLGLGLRPDVTGSGYGQAFVEACLDFTRERFAPAQFLLYVLAFNQRAIRTYEKAGFARVRAFRQQNKYGSSEFVEMRKKA